jgi:hypothetical protein
MVREHQQQSSHSLPVLVANVADGQTCAHTQAARLAGLERQYNKDLKDMLDEAAR